MSESSRGDATNYKTNRCPNCGSAEAWHGVIVEPDEAERFACDDCGTSMAINPAPMPAAPKLRRRFSFSFEISDGTLEVDWCGAAVLSFKPGWFLTLGTLTRTVNIISGREEERLQQQWTNVGLDVGRREADRVWEAIKSGKAHHINLHTIAPGRVEGSCSCGEWHPVAAPDAETMWEAARAHREAVAW